MITALIRACKLFRACVGVILSANFRRSLTSQLNSGLPHSCPVSEKASGGTPDTRAGAPASASTQMTRCACLPPVSLPALHCDLVIKDGWRTLQNLLRDWRLGDLC